MSSRSERDKSKGQQDRNQMILSQLLKDEDNKYCVDCDAKGPRWASWNLGIFLCIRCAGIHRNLGVHISKVKSVNLDTWTAEQIAMMQEMGNSRARAVYEANLPDNFRRPQTDSGLEAFVRAKYEMKKYIAQEWIPPQPRIHNAAEDSAKKEKKKSRPRPASSVQLNNVPAPTKSTTSTKAESKPVTVTLAKESKPAPPPAASVDLLGLDTPAINTTSSASTDPFGDFISVNPVTNGDVPSSKPSESGTNSDLQDMNLFTEPAAPVDKQKQTKENIMALFGSGTGGSSSQMFNVPGGVYMQPQQGQQQQQQMWGGVGGAQNGVMPNNHSTPNMGMQGMMGTPMGTGVPQMPNMMMGQMPAGQQAAMMQQTAMMQNMYNTNTGMYNMPQQLQQVQNQMGSMNLGAGAMSGMPPQQAGMVAAGGSGSTWGTPASGQTLSNNLWQ